MFLEIISITNVVVHLTQVGSAKGRQLMGDRLKTRKTYSRPVFDAAAKRPADQNLLQPLTTFCRLQNISTTNCRRGVLRGCRNVENRSFTSV